MTEGTTRDTFSSKWGFILASAGSAVGLGNLWMFPWRLGEYGGAAFLVPYLIFVYVLGTTGLMGEFAFEDIASEEVEKYTYKWLRDETYEGHECFVIERYPVDKDSSGYTRMVSWIDKEEYRILKVEFFDRKDSHLKTLTAYGYQRYVEQYWRADGMEMVNHQNGKSTTLAFSDYKFRVGLNEGDFSKNALKRVR